MNAKRDDPDSEKERWERRFKGRVIPQIKLELFEEPDLQLNQLVGLDILPELKEEEGGEAVDGTQAPKRIRVVKPEDDLVVQHCLEMTNRLAAEHQRDKSAQEARSIDQMMEARSLGQFPSESNRLGAARRLDFHTNFEPMSNLRRDYVHEPSVKRNSDGNTLTANPSHGKAEITGNTFKLGSIEELLSRLFVDGLQFHNMRSDKREEALQGHEKPVDTVHYIQKLLVIPRGPFPACMNLKLNLCEADRNPQLRHPLAEPGTGCQAYCLEPVYREVISALRYSTHIPSDTIRPDVCEFCYRKAVATQVHNIVNNNHRALHEVASRLYQAGVKGGYSIEGTYQPTTKTTTAYPDGILGHVRTYSTADFLPVMLRFSDGEILDTLGIREYKNRGSPEGYVPGWQEVKYIQNLNCNALLTVPQINPYQIAIPGNGDNLNVDGILRVYCEQRQHFMLCKVPLPRGKAQHVFRDLGECLADPAYLEGIQLDKFLHWRPHGDDEPPQPIEQHRIYYTLLLKINALKDWTTEQQRVQAPGFILQKMRVFLSQHHPLMDFIDKNRIFSDNELLQPIFKAPHTGLPISALYANWPWPKQHFRSDNYVYSRPCVTLRIRPNPEQTCIEYYIGKPIRSLGELKHVVALSLDSDQSIAYQLKQALAQLPSLRRKFSENCDALDYYGVSALHWVEPEGNWSDSDSLKLLNIISQQIVENYGQQLTFISSKQARYVYLLQSFGELVICRFDVTHDWVVGLSNEKLTMLIREFKRFLHCLPESLPRRVTVTDTRFGSRSWGEHRVLVAALLRVAVMEELHELEPVKLRDLRYNLRLFSGSHLKLVGRILGDPTDFLTDHKLLADGRTGQDRAGSLYASYYPYSERELHEGALPDYINSLAKVDFFAETGMESYAFNKIFYKLPDRACDTRELSDVLVQHCKNSPPFYNYVCMLLELSLKGNYKHCTVATSFSRKLGLEELFRNNRGSMKAIIQQLIMDNQSMIADALSEALCFMIEFAPALKEMLVELYKEWFSWRVYINMDMIRHCYNVDGNFIRARAVVYRRVDLKITRSIYRQKESDFVIWLATLIKKANEERYKEVAKIHKGAPLEAELEAERKIDDDTRLLVRLFVRALPENAVIDVKDLKLVGLTRESLKKMNELYDCFLAQNQPGSRGTDARYAFPEKALFKILNEIEKPQYAILYYFVTILQNYQSIHSMRIDNYDILKQQCDRLTETAQGLGLDHIPPDLTRFCFTPFCCNSVKTTFPARVDTEAYGHEEIAYDSTGEFYACSKHKFQPAKNGGLKLDIPEAKGDERIKAKMQRQVEREDQKPNCKDAEVCFYEALGEVIVTDGVKVPRSKKNKKTDPKKADIKKLPCSSWWITPCCGKRYSYDFWCWQDSTYCCGTCQKGNDIALSYQTLICEVCLESIRDVKQYLVLRVYDDEEMQCFRNMIVCKRCVSHWRQGLPKVLLKTQLREVARNEDYLPWLTGGEIAIEIAEKVRKRKHV